MRENIRISDPDPARPSSWPWTILRQYREVVGAVLQRIKLNASMMLRAAVALGQGDSEQLYIDYDLRSTHDRYRYRYLRLFRILNSNQESN